MADDPIQIRLTQAEGIVLFEWLARSDDLESLPCRHPAEQKVLWSLEAQLEKQVEVFSPDYKLLVDEARNLVDRNL